jgi:hypothetical protein
MSESIERESNQGAPEALESVRRIEDRVGRLAGESLRWIARACAGFALLLGVVIFLIGAVVFANAPAMMALIVPIPAVAGALIFYARDRKPTLPLGIRKTLSIAGVITAVLVVATAALLALADLRSPAFWTFWGLAVAAPFAVTAVRVARAARGGRHGR